MPWCISVIINEVSRKEALCQLEKIVETMKAEETVFHEPEEQDPYKVPYFEYDSYEGL